MKKILLASTMLAGFAGAAFAESHESAPAVSLSGDARMGIVNYVGTEDTVFTSRARVKFTLSGESDGGLEFGASFRADNAGRDFIDDDTYVTGAREGLAGEVHISGSFGKLSMGDVDGAALAAVGHVDGVGLTGLGDLNESVYIGGGTKESVLYEYSTGSLTFYASAGQLTHDDSKDYDPGVTATPIAVGAKYATDAYSVAVGWEDNDEGTTHAIIGASTTFSNVTLKANYGSASGVVDGTQSSVSATYAMDALSATAFWADSSEIGGTEAYGVGASYDLGGGLSVVGGWAKDKTNDDDGFDLGLSMSF